MGNIKNQDIHSEVQADNLAKWKRSGYRGIYNKLIELGIFADHQQSHLNAVKKASFEEAISFIAMDNVLA